MWLCVWLCVCVCVVEVGVRWGPCGWWGLRVGRARHAACQGLLLVGGRRRRRRWATLRRADLCAGDSFLKPPLPPVPAAATPGAPLPPQIVSVDEHGAGIKRIRPKSLYDMLKVRRRRAWRRWARGVCVPTVAGPDAGPCEPPEGPEQEGRRRQARRGRAALLCLPSTLPTFTPWLVGWCTWLPQAAGHCIPEDDEVDELPLAAASSGPPSARSRPMLSHP